jgi:hypothetical protein
MRIITALGLCLCGVMLCALLSPSTKADEWNKETIATFSAPVEIPGRVLSAGTYVFKLLDSPGDRNIVEIWNGDKSQLVAIILTIPDYRVEPTDTPTFQLKEQAGDAPMALHSWFYPGDNMGQEFVYYNR